MRFLRVPRWWTVDVKKIFPQTVNLRDNSAFFLSAGLAAWLCFSNLNLAAIAAPYQMPQWEPMAERPIYSSNDPLTGMHTPLTAYIGQYNQKLAGPSSQQYATLILNLSRLYDVDFRLISSIVAVESSFRRDAISPTGAIGLGQLRPETARWLGVVDPFDPVDNLFGTTRYLKYLLNRFNGNLDKALASYFQGPGSVERNGIDSNTWYYLSKINREISRFEQNLAVNPQ